MRYQIINLTREEFEKNSLIVLKKQMPNKGLKLHSKIREIVLKNISSDNLTVMSLANELGLSRSTLHRKLIKYYKKNTSRTINEIKLEEAKRLMSFTDMTISEIAYATGFSSPSYFGKVFQDTCGTTPKSFYVKKKK